VGSTGCCRTGRADGRGLYRKAINGVLIRDLNIKGPRLVGGQPYTDRDGRVLYADTISPTGAVTDTNQIW